MTRSLLAATLFAAVVSAQPREFKPGFNLFSPEEDIEMGKQAAQEVEKSRAVVHNSEIEAYLTKIGSRLAQSRYAGQFPFRFHVVNDKSVNAFAFPGGPVYVQTGLLAVVDNETQLAGVLAHEMSHVALRHGTHQASKAVPLSAAAALLGALIGDQSTASKMAQLGINFGAQSVLLKYSRDNESEADLNGAMIMNDVGYDPRGMAAFFEKLQSLGGQGNSRLENFFSDHPSPANRVGAVDDEIRQLPRKSYHETDPQELTRIKKIVASLPPPPPTPKPGDGR